jgi:hypothetical protein
MNTKFKHVLKFLGLYIVQAGTLWGLLDGYTYFKGDALKNFLGPYWILIYIIPLFTTVLITREAKDVGNVQESITTQGDFSPGKVGGNYSVRTQLDNPAQSESSSEVHEESQSSTSSDEPKQVIRTKGKYSPGKVEGDYKIDG